MPFLFKNGEHNLVLPLGEENDTSSTHHVRILGIMYMWLPPGNYGNNAYFEERHMLSNSTDQYDMLTTVCILH